MKNKIFISFGLVALFFVVFFVLKHVFNYGKQEEIIENQVQEIQNQNEQIEKQGEAIETKNLQQKIISKTSVNIDALARREWMQLLFEERSAENN